MIVFEAGIPPRCLLLEVRLDLGRLSRANCDRCRGHSKSGTSCIRSMVLYLYSRRSISRIGTPRRLDNLDESCELIRVACNSRKQRHFRCGREAFFPPKAIRA